MRKGSKLTTEQKDKIRNTLKSKGIKPLFPYKGIPWNKGKSNIWAKGNKYAVGMIPWNKGLTKFDSEKIMRVALSKQGDKCNFWKGGLTDKNKMIRVSVEYKLWRTAVFIRDNFICIWCGSNKEIQADHIKPFAYFPELRFAIDNGRTLCRECHKTTDTWGVNLK